MLIIKRLLTSGILFIFSFILLSFGILILGSAIAGGIAGANDPENAREVGRIAGEDFGAAYRTIIGLGSLLISAVSSLYLSFGGIIPWCKNTEKQEEKTFK
ncbi:MAG: hypothetical protein NE330_22055 [Lentisphaeraceae bacterium]|nr:hypothetical protein [Lentisphaeraceae bacterium]